MSESTQELSQDSNALSSETVVPRTPELPRQEVSAQTIARMMGIPTVADLKLLESKIELLSPKLNAITMKVDRIAASLSTVPTASDMDRMEIQMGAVKSLTKEILDLLSRGTPAVDGEAAAAAEQGKRLRAGIRTSDSE
jgi:hypothetical protein